MPSCRRSSTGKTRPLSHRDRLSGDESIEFVRANRMRFVAGPVLGNHLAAPLAVQPLLQCKAKQFGPRLPNTPCRAVQMSEQGLVYGY